MNWSLPYTRQPWYSSFNCGCCTRNIRLYDWNLKYRKIPKISPGAYISQRPFRRGLSTEGNLRFKIDWASLIVGSKFTVFALFYFVFEGNFQVQAPPPGGGGLYLEGRFNGGFFELRFWGAYIWRGLYMEELIFGILRYSTKLSTVILSFNSRWGCSLIAKLFNWAYQTLSSSLASLET